jgi:hypothetical protein
MAITAYVDLHDGVAIDMQHEFGWPAGLATPDDPEPGNLGPQLSRRHPPQHDVPAPTDARRAHDTARRPTWHLTVAGHAAVTRVGEAPNACPAVPAAASPGAYHPGAAYWHATADKPCANLGRFDRTSGTEPYESRRYRAKPAARDPIIIRRSQVRVLSPA